MAVLGPFMPLAWEKQENECQERRFIAYFSQPTDAKSQL